MAHVIVLEYSVWKTDLFSITNRSGIDVGNDLRMENQWKWTIKRKFVKKFNWQRSECKWNWCVFVTSISVANGSKQQIRNIDPDLRRSLLLEMTTTRLTYLRTIAGYLLTGHSLHFIPVSIGCSWLSYPCSSWMIVVTAWTCVTVSKLYQYSEGYYPKMYLTASKRVASSEYLPRRNGTFSSTMKEWNLQ